VPASTANLGPGFDALGMALGLHAELGTGDPPEPRHAVDGHHPADVAYRRAGGTGRLWVRSPIPMGRGLGYSGAMRVGGAALGVLEAAGRSELTADDRHAVLAVATELEGHPDNAAASVHGGVVVAAGGRVVPVPLAVEVAVVAWIPERSTTSTDRSRAALPDLVTRADATFNVGRTAMLVAALASGDVAALADATEDRLHQPIRLAAAPASAAALAAGRAAGAWCGWLSGSGPTVAFLCDPVAADAVVAGLPADGHARVLAVDHAGVCAR
jgi:homoserine kinase